MFHLSLLPILSIVGVSLISLIGIFFFLVRASFIERILLPLVSFSTGAILGDVFLHMIPDIAGDPSFLPRASITILGGILFSFVVEKIIHWRHCHLLEEHHDHHHPAGVLSIIGESVHNCIDGIVIAAAYLVSPSLGVATTLAILFHEIPHEIGNFAILLHSGYSKKRALLFNAFAALTSIFGALAVFASSSAFSETVQYALPFAAGNLLYIAGSDLIPELHKRTSIRDSLYQLLGMLLGMLVMYGALFLE